MHKIDSIKLCDIFDDLLEIDPLKIGPIKFIDESVFYESVLKKWRQPDCFEGFNFIRSDIELDKCNLVVTTSNQRDGPIPRKWHEHDALEWYGKDPEVETLSLLSARQIARVISHPTDAQSLPIPQRLKDYVQNLDSGPRGSLTEPNIRSCSSQQRSID